MTEATSSPPARPSAPLLALSDSLIDRANPWNDDALGRNELATRLTDLVLDPKGLATLSLHGDWGTGKTFFLERWQQTLRSAGFDAIYFNAWQDDFIHDPLLAILGQMAEELPRLEEKKMARTAIDLAGKLVVGAGNEAVQRYTGVNIQRTFKMNRGNRRSTAAQYSEQVRTRTNLKRSLRDLAKSVSEATDGKPLIFIIDELDRCRPTFAIELLERVKHIFDVQNVIFVFGINRDELAKSLQSIYGMIDADVYLRRFFDLEINLPPADLSEFTLRLISQFQLPSFFEELDGERQRPFEDNFVNVRRDLPALVGGLGVSLRDIHYCVRLLSLIARQHNPENWINPIEVTGLVALRIADPKLYLRFVRGEARTRDVVDCFVKRTPNWPEGSGRHQEWERIMDLVEGLFLRSEIRRRTASDQVTSLDSELKAVEEGLSIPAPQFVSDRVISRGKEAALRIRELISFRSFRQFEGDAIAGIAERIELHSQFMRR